ncbi:putative HTH-type transcriptional regulator [Actinobacillus equuli]|nr:putative HTH-type transcriptional regulator [Actinobacillus equuli]
MSARGKILDTIGALQTSLTKTEKKIASAILAQPEILSQNSLSEVAKQLDVGEATFIRFCRTLGFKGYTDFKLDLAIELATQESKVTQFLIRMCRKPIHRKKLRLNYKVA